jgi:hypothetical protein
MADLRQPPRPCPDCGESTVVLNRKFKAPSTEDVKQWAKVRFPVDHGFRFGAITDESGYRVSYPATLNDARKFVRQYADVATVGWLLEDAAPKRRRKGPRRPPLTPAPPEVSSKDSAEKLLKNDRDYS